jgi:hypothetical protein
MGIVLIAGIAIMLALAVSAGAATATERINDGGFDQAACTTAGCTGGAWSHGASVGVGSAIGPICSDLNHNCLCNTPAICTPTIGFHSSHNWARVGAAEEDPDTEISTVDSFVQQDIQVPASFPPAPLATLHFFLRIIPTDDSSNETLTVSLGGTPVLNVDDGDTGYGIYEPVDVPLDALVGPGAKTLRFEASGTFRHVSTSFDIDDVSVTAPDALGPPAVSAGPTGQRAAALAKCNKKHSKKARKKCRKKANLLPV